MRGFRGSRLVPPIPRPDRDPMSSVGYSAHVSDPMLDDEVSPVRNIRPTYAELHRFTLSQPPRVFGRAHGVSVAVGHWKILYAHRS
jgi:hypothetical protein